MNNKNESIVEERLKWGTCDIDQYEAEVKFGENSTFEVGSVLLEGKKSNLILDFPFSRCYRVTDRELGSTLYQIPQSSQNEAEYPLYKIKNSLFIKEVVRAAGGVLESDELEHYQVISDNLVLDVILYKGEQISIQKEGGNDGILG